MLNKAILLNWKTCKTYYLFAAVIVVLAILPYSLMKAYGNNSYWEWFLPLLIAILVSLCWAKALNRLLSDSISGESAPLYMTLPITEKDTVLSKVLMGGFLNAMLYTEIVTALIIVTVFLKTTEETFISALLPLQQAGFSGMEITLTFALLPLVILAEQVFFCTILLACDLLSFAKNPTRQCGISFHFLLLLVSHSLNYAVVYSYPQIAAKGINPVALTTGVIALLVILSALLIKREITILTKEYNI